MSKSPFLMGQCERFHAALTRFDPFRDEPLHRLIDPVPRDRSLKPEEGQLPWLRLFILWCLMVVPTIGLALIPSKLCGGTFLRGPNPVVRDIALWTQYVLFAVWLVWMVHARRLLGDLVNHLAANGTVTVPGPFTLTANHEGQLLRILEWASRLTPVRLLFWIPVLLVLNVNNQYQALGGDLPNWASTSVDPGTLLYVFSRSGQQPSLAGTWHLSIVSPSEGT